MADIPDVAHSGPGPLAPAPAPALMPAPVPAPAPAPGPVTAPDLVRAGTLIERMGIEIVEASPQRVVATMPVAGNTQPYGLLHGGASCVLAETLGSIGASLHAAAHGRIALGTDINATHHRAMSSGRVTGVATPAHLGRAIASYDVVLTDERGRRVCSARLTCLLRPTPMPTAAEPAPPDPPAQSPPAPDLAQ